MRKSTYEINSKHFCNQHSKEILEGIVECKVEAQAQKRKYGEFSNVLLTNDELGKLKSRFSDYENRIERLSNYLASSGKRYQSHYATILNWAERDKVSQNEGVKKHGTDESEVGRRAQCTEFLDVESTDGSELSSEEIARIRAENEEFAKLGV